jgi:hypothetical protein
MVVIESRDRVHAFQGVADILIQFFDEHLAVLTFGGELAIMDH